MKNRNKFIKKTAAEILIAVLATVNVSTFALADTNSVKVEITEYGPVETASSEQERSASLGPAGSIVSDGTVISDGNSSSAATAETTAASIQETTAAASQVTEGPTGTAANTPDTTAETKASSEASAATSGSAASSGTVTEAAETTAASGTDAASATNYFKNSGNTKSFLKTSLTATPEVNANFAILVDTDSNLVIADKNGESRMNPASMTKVMTLLVACEHLSDLSEKVEITQDIVDYVQKEGASNCGFKAGEKVTVQDLLYGLILPSGADAALALVRHIAGSEAQFVNLMNQKAQELGISATTHYTNCTGLYDADHYTTAKDMALVMKYAAADPYASAVLSTRSYTTKATNKHSSGLSFSNLFLKRIDGQETGGEAMMAKTGYVAKAGNCAVSYFTAASGRHYICVTGKTSGAWNVVYAHADLYKKYGK
ncbi:MAG: D-alanyl-D-alanine carboxypeptidase [Oribacterium sp.]|nr:D-alanyl-D-alanine carboxypeptidase [Oribacterium sp.]